MGGFFEKLPPIFEEPSHLRSSIVFLQNILCQAYLRMREHDERLSTYGFITATRLATVSPRSGASCPALLL